ncbi:cardiolipin synthase [Geoalkalibacter subterraneus]|uniref:cardiolipin synthase n=1 Tax=Geoalkalibacter subterraneus TaxID=483547 RepID=UPI00190FB0B7|nr:cardiolipin synthase [Geoalkalibacter subterraneus]
MAHIAGALTSVQAVMETRTAQGAIAWAVSLNTIPYAAVPAYWAVGRTKFEGYVKKRQDRIDETSPFVRQFIDSAKKDFPDPDQDIEAHFLERLIRLPTTRGNDVQLLRNGEEIYSSIFRGMESAEDYLLVQFYIVRDDDLGKKLQQQMLAAAQRGVRVKFLYDQIGSRKLPHSYLDALRQSGVKVHSFISTRDRFRPFQLNFRNHRKIVVVDGRQAWLGGANIGEEYLHADPKLSPWIDAMVKVEGPAVQAVQVPFLEDWYWTSGDIPDLDWAPQAASTGKSRKVFVLPTGPADRFETCALYFLHMINNATHRLWIASPYFVPDEQIVSALQMAALRGVDVRILIPENCDNFMVNLSGWSYVAELEKAGVEIYRHTNGFLHYKALLVDDSVSAVGTANFDNRSFRLNFEITLEVEDEEFAQEVKEMFLHDFADSRLSSAKELEERHFIFRLAVRVARLFAPIQ